MRQRVIRYLEYAWSTQGLCDERNLLDELPFSLRLQLTLETHKKLFSDVPFFRQVTGARHRTRPA